MQSHGDRLAPYRRYEPSHRPNGNHGTQPSVLVFFDDDVLEARFHRWQGGRRRHDSRDGPPLLPCPIFRVRHRFQRRQIIDAPWLRWQYLGGREDSRGKDVLRQEDAVFELYCGIDVLEVPVDSNRVTFA